jgi:cytidylate kinase
MAIITISRGSHSKGTEIAEKVAQRLGYECVSREVLLAASEHFNIPEVKLIRALHDAPSVLDRFSQGKQRYVAFIEEAFLERMQKDNVVYHGLAGHFFLRGVSHALKVRILADPTDRIRFVMDRDRVSKEEARRIIEKDDHERHKWAMSLYGIDTSDASLYDLVIHVRKISPDDAVDLICHTAQLPGFQTTPESQKAMDDLVLAAQVKSAIIDRWPELSISADNGTVTVRIDAPLIQEHSIREELTPHIKKVPGVREARVHVVPSTVFRSL